MFSVSRAVAVVVFRVIEAVFGAKEEAGGSKDGGYHNKDEFDVHKA